MSARVKVGVRNECEGQGWACDNNWRCKNTTPIVITRSTLINEHNNKIKIQEQKHNQTKCSKNKKMQQQKMQQQKCKNNKETQIIKKI